VKRAAALLLVLAAACSNPAKAPATESAATPATSPSAKRYVISGQIIAVKPDTRSLTIKHGDIVGYMPAMTMTFQVGRADLMTGREPGELITGTLEVGESSAAIVEITHTGTAALPDRASPSSISMAAEVLDVGAPAPDAALIDENDTRRSFAEWRGTPTLVTFIYTRCPLPNFCPLMDRNFAKIQRDASADPALKGKFKLVSVSFDPEHDTPAVLKAHARELGADAAVWTFLTADKITIDRFAAKFGVGVVRDSDAPGVITHNLRTTLIGADGKILKIYGGSDWTVATALADLRAAVAASGQ
jgi:protein SCO1/2